MHYLSAQNISKHFSEKPVLTNINFHIHEGSKIALFGRNGNGKTTLLNIIAKREIPDGGSLQHLSNLNIIFVNQHSVFNQEKSLLDNILDIDNERVRTLVDYNKMLTDATNPDSDMTALLAQMEELDVWNLELEIEKIISKLSIKHLMNQPIAHFSGGELKRLAIARALVELIVATSKHTLLLLDEPTNHLDIKMIDWLQQYLIKRSDSLLMVTHDRYFLDEVCDEIWELDNGKMNVYKGKYDYYVEQKALSEMAAQASIAKAKNTYAKELEWIRKQPKARTTKSKVRVDRFADVESKAKQKVDKQYIQLNINAQRLGSKIVEMKHVNKCFGDKTVLEQFTYTFSQGEKIGLIGKNGVGKTSFLQLIQQLIKPDSGTIKTGETVSFGYYNQKGLEYEQDCRIIEYVKNIAEFFPLAKGQSISAASFLEMFLFPRDKQFTFLSSLSGGERRRLQLLTILFSNPNFLILDEPTNDLDIDTLIILEKFLQDFPGCVLIVSHDRRFMDKVVDVIFSLESGGKLKTYPGNYTDYLDLSSREDAKDKKITTPKIKPSKPATKAPSKVSYKVQYELDAIEKEIQTLTLTKDKLLQQLEKPQDLPYEEIKKISDQLETVVESIKQNETRWLSLQEE